MESEIFFSKVYNEDKSRMFRLKTEWEQNMGYFRLYVVENASAWFALVTKDDINKLVEQHNIDEDVYFRNLREYIVEDQSSVTFDVVDSQFIVYRKIKNQRFRMKYFFIKLKEVKYEETIGSFIDELVAIQTNLQQQLKFLKDEKQETENQKLALEQKCEQFAELKSKSELQMLSSFTLILNEKKHRIRYLTELLEEYKGGRKLKNNDTITVKKEENGKCHPTKVKKEKEVLKPAPREIISDSDSDSNKGYNTDEEKNSRVKMETEPIPGSSTDNLDFLGGDSPPPPSVPKRMKREQKDTCSVISNNVKIVNEETNPSKEDMNIDQEDSDDSLKFNTQELLDIM